MTTKCWVGCRATIFKGENPDLGKIVYVQGELPAQYYELPVGHTYKAFGIAWTKTDNDFMWVVESLDSPFMRLDDMSWSSKYRFYKDEFLVPMPDEDECMEDLIEYAKPKLNGAEMLRQMLGGGGVKK